MAKRTLFNKIWDAHRVLDVDGQTQLWVSLHLVHEVTSPQAFDMMRQKGIKAVAFPKQTIATADHIISTTSWARPFADPEDEAMMKAEDENCREFGVEQIIGEKQGIVHVIGPELGLTQPGKLIACGDSHTSTHGAFGNLALGVGTTQLAGILATGCILDVEQKVRRIEVNGELNPGVTAKDIILYIIWKLGVSGGVGYAYEYAGTTIRRMSMEQRMTLCNMTIEGGSRFGYVEPDETTFKYMRGRERVPQGKMFDKFIPWWTSLCSDKDAVYDDVVKINAEEIPPMITWGVNSGQSIPVDGTIPENAEKGALEYTHGIAGEKILGKEVQVAFLGSCTNGRIEDFREVARAHQLYGWKVAPGVQALAVPGSASVREQAMKEKLHEVLINAGWEWRMPGCSSCLGMNPDLFKRGQVSVSSSNRNYKGRQGPGVITHLMSPLGVAFAASRGKISDVRELFQVPAN